MSLSLLGLVVKLDDVELDDGPVLQHALEVEHGEVQRLVRALQQELRHGPSHRRRLRFTRDRYLSATSYWLNVCAQVSIGVTCCRPWPEKPLAW